MTWVAISSSLVLFVCLGVVALRSRGAIRSLWTRIEQLQLQIQAERIATNRARNELYSEIASIIHNKPIRFQSQHGEDIYLWNHFGRKTRGVCVEVGAFDGISCSNSYAFESMGWNCILVEPDPEMAKQCHENRPNSEVVQAAAGNSSADGMLSFNVVRTDADWAGMMSFTHANSKHLAKCRQMGAQIRTIEVPHRSLNEILCTLNDPIDFITIDVEGHELEVLDGFDLERYRPEIVVTENNYDRDEDKIGSYLRDRGYLRLDSIGCNDIFARAIPNQP